MLSPFVKKLIETIICRFRRRYSLFVFIIFSTVREKTADRYFGVRVQYATVKLHT